MNIRAIPQATSFMALSHLLSCVPPEDLQMAVQLALAAKQAGQRFFFIGNGGSAAIASHMAADWLKAGGVAAMSFNEPALITALANDLGYQHAFSQPLDRHGKRDDLLFAISSSGESWSVINAAFTAHRLGMKIITLSGFAPDNPLHDAGSVNFHVASNQYGLVEVAHHAICHAILDAVIDAQR